MPCPDIKDYILHPHALTRLAERQLTQADIAAVLAAPEQREEGQKGRCIYQARVRVKGKHYLLRVAVDVQEDPPLVLTAYLTSQIQKYWR